MNKSIAFGFYVRHSEAFDAIMECERDSKDQFVESVREQGLKRELSDIVLANWKTTTNIINDLEMDVEKFEQTLLVELQRRLEKYVAFKKRRNPYWGGAVRIRHKTIPAAILRDAEIGWSIKTLGRSVFIRPWIWASGGRETERIMLDLLEKWAPDLKPERASELGEGWSSGTLALTKIDCQDARYLGELDAGVDTTLLLADLIAAFSWIKQTRINKILQLGLKQK